VYIKVEVHILLKSVKNTIQLKVYWQKV